MDNRIKRDIENLTPTHLGYFGEELFTYYVKSILKKEIYKLHKEGKDFQVDGVKIDVGTRRPLDNFRVNCKIYKKEAFVFFFSECCYIDYPKHFSGKIKWKQVSLLLKNYKQSRIKVDTIKKKPFTAEYTELANRIKLFFSKNGFESDIIYRTVSKRFGLRESPHNLLLKKFTGDGIKVYIDFNDYHRTIENIRFIISFPQSLEEEIPKQKRVSLKSGNSEVNKVDLIAIKKNKHRCYFTNLEDLMKYYFVRYRKNGNKWL